MSTKIAVVCEDPTNDRYILRPVFSALLDSLGKPRATLLVVDNPRVRGDQSVISHACDFIKRYHLIADAVVFVLDQDLEDGRDGRPNKAARLRNAINRCDEGTDKSISVLAVQEVEVWALWGVRGGLRDSWAQVREERDPKELYFEPLLDAADRIRADGGRTRLIGSSLSSGWQSLTDGCPELARAEQDIGNVLQQDAP